MALSRELVEDLAAWIEGWLLFHQRTLRIPGVQFAVAHEGEVVRAGSCGVADLATAEPLSNDHRFGICSQSKTYTATAVMQLAEAGTRGLSLEDRLVKYLPRVRSGTALARLAGLSILDVLHHGSGLSSNGSDGDYWQLQRPFAETEDLFELIAESPSPYPPNERMHYSSLAYALLGFVVASVSGSSYAEYVQHSILDVLGLRSTSPEYLPADPGIRYAIGYTNAHLDHRRLPMEHGRSYAMAPSTGFTSTASDLVLWYSAHCFGDERVLSDAAKRRMQHAWWTRLPNDHYGLGLQLLDLPGRRLIGHSGGHPGHITRGWCDPRDRLAVAVFMNAIDAPARQLCTGIFRLLDHVARADSSLPAHAKGADLRSFCGHFLNIWDTYDVARFGNRLLYVPCSADDPTTVLGELVVETSDTARLISLPGDGEGELFRFHRDDVGRITSVHGYSGYTGYPESEYRRRFLAGDRLDVSRPRAAAGPVPNR